MKNANRNEFKSYGFFRSDMMRGRKMGQKPHPFTIPVVDETNGAFLTSGDDCYSPGGKKRSGSCAGVFRAKQPGIYKFSLIGAQTLTQKGPSHFTGWIKLNGKAYAGAYSSATDMSHQGYYFEILEKSKLIFFL